MEKVTTLEVSDWVLSYLEGLSCPRALTVAVMYRHGMIADIQLLDCPPVNYLNADHYRRAVAATKLMSKLTLKTELDPVTTATEAWLAAEKQCFCNNTRLYEMLDFGTDQGVPTPAASSFFDAVRENMVWLIGKCPPRNVQGVFGPGATISDTSARTTVPHKMSSIPTLTASAWVHLPDWMSSRWAAACAARGDSVSEVCGNVYFQVPKNAVTNRSCAKEASINAYYQRAYGVILARRLARRGFNFDRAKEIHMQVACKASITGSFATLDLKSASDTICVALVKAALPSDWFEILDSLRSRTTLLGDRNIRLEKFSSMGNGFTFELEMAIFTAIILAVAPELRVGVDLFVWGDDIIVPTERAEIVKKALQFCGLTLNTVKSFVKGPFRESCGGDFWDGEAVRPYFLKEFPHEPQEYIAVANGIKKLASSDLRPRGLQSDLLRAWFRVLDRLPSNIRRCRGPDGLGDLVIHDAESRWSVRLRNSIRYVQVYRPHRFSGVKFNRFDSDVQIAAALYGVAFQEIISSQRGFPRWYYKPGVDLRTVTLRGDPLSYKVGWTAFS